MNQHPEYVFSWGALAARGPCRPADQRIIREARERAKTPNEDEPRGAYPSKLVAHNGGDNRSAERR